METLKINKRKVLALTIIVLILGFILLSGIVYFLPTTLIDLNISLRIQRYQNDVLDKIMAFISWFGTMPWSVLTVLCTALAFLLFGYKREAVFTLLTLSSGLLSTVIKLLINRDRPGKDVVRIIEVTRQQSFPSGHTLFYTIFFGFLIIIMGNLKGLPQLIRITVMTISGFMILTVPLSRIYLGAHWFTDVLAGAILGILSLFVLGYYYLPKNNEKRLPDE
jgi:membrane-associated phospholipid phosphatase